MTISHSAISKICSRISNQISEDGKMNGFSLIEFSTATGLVLDLLEDLTKNDKIDPAAGSALLALYAKTQLRSEFRDLFLRLFKAAGGDGKRLYELSNSVCYASSSGKLNQQEDYDFFKNLFIENHGEHYFEELKEKLKQRGIGFSLADLT